MFTRTIKTATVAAVVLLATAGASFAAQYAWVDQDAKVKFKPKNSSQTVNYVEEGQKVRILAENGNWVKIKIPGDDGWVKAGTLDFDHYYDDDYYDYGYSGSASVCLGSPHVSFCVGN